MKWAFTQILINIIYFFKTKTIMTMNKVFKNLLKF